MIHLVQKNTEAITKLCKKHNVAELYLFGSAVTSDFTKQSDLDFAVSFREELSPLERGDAFFALLDGLELLFKRKIDLISYQVVKNPVFKEELDKTKISLYAA